MVPCGSLIQPLLICLGKVLSLMSTMSLACDMVHADVVSECSHSSETP
jgi:hypothetical protein